MASASAGVLLEKSMQLSADVHIAMQARGFRGEVFVLEDPPMRSSDWRDYARSGHSELAGTVNAAHLLATHTLHPELLDEALVLDSPVFEQLSVFPDDRRRMLAKRDHVRALAGM